MKTYTAGELKEIVRLHGLWLAGPATGSRADLGGANLGEAFLGGANLTGAILTGANLGEAYLGGAYLRGATLTVANLTKADLGGANLTVATLTGANLTGATLPPFQIVPEVGQFRAFKKVQGNVVLEILIPRSAQRTSTLVGRKCRASKVKVVGVASGATTETVFRSHHEESFTYTVGKWASVPDYDGDIRVECTKGIHFFLTLDEAKNY